MPGRLVRRAWKNKNEAKDDRKHYQGKAKNDDKPYNITAAFQIGASHTNQVRLAKLPNDLAFAETLKHVDDDAKIQPTALSKPQNIHAFNLVENDEIHVKNEVVSFEQKSLPQKNSVPILHIIDNSDITPRFVIVEGQVLNNYGTHKLYDPKYVKFFKADLVDSHNSNTITLVVGAPFINQFALALSVGSFVRIEGGSIKTKNKVDGGTSTFSLYLDTSSIISCVESFPVHLSFYLETKIRLFLNEAVNARLGGVKSFMGTLAFVVIKSENLEIDKTPTRGELLIANGPTPQDRAILTFVNDGKEDYKKIKKDIDNGQIVMHVGRNLGAFLGRENTLSVLDLITLVPVQSKRLERELTQAYNKQVESLGYGTEIFGVLHFLNINSVLVESVCGICKSNKVHKIAEGSFCITCQQTTPRTEIPKLQVEIKPKEGVVIKAQVGGATVDEILHLNKPFYSVYSKSAIAAREILASTTRSGTFKINLVGHVIAFLEHKNT
ncbi:hypothetical protein L7F22_020349 [Adiantum nelumboides]|nr:hypothetical protein [Adiantum nelumboides]